MSIAPTLSMCSSAAHDSYETTEHARAVRSTFGQRFGALLSRKVEVQKVMVAPNLPHHCHHLELVGVGR